MQTEINYIKSEKIKALDLNNKLVVAGTYNGSILLYNLHTHEEVKRISLTMSPIRAIKFIKKHNMVVCGTDTRCLIVVELSQFETVFKQSAHNDYIRSIDINENKRWILSSGDDLTIRLWNYNVSDGVFTCDMYRSFTGHSHFVMTVKFSLYDENVFYSCSLDKKLYMWNVSSDKRISKVASCERGINTFAMLKKHRTYIAFGSDDRNVYVWDIHSKNVVSKLKKHVKYVTSLYEEDVTGDLYSASEDGYVYVWSTETMSHKATHAPSMGRVWCIAGSERNLVFGCDEGLVLLTSEGSQTHYALDSSSIYVAKNDTIVLNTVSIEPTARDELRLEEPCNSLVTSQTGKYVGVVYRNEVAIYNCNTLKKVFHTDGKTLCWLDGTTFAVGDTTHLSLRIYSNFKETLKLPIENEKLFGGKLIAAVYGTCTRFLTIEGEFIFKVEKEVKNVVWAPGTLILTSNKVQLYSFDEDVLFSFVEQGLELDFASYFTLSAEIETEESAISDSIFMYVKSAMLYGLNLDDITRDAIVLCPTRGKLVGVSKNIVFFLTQNDEIVGTELDSVFMNVSALLNSGLKEEAYKMALSQENNQRKDQLSLLFLKHKYNEEALQLATTDQTRLKALIKMERPSEAERVASTDEDYRLIAELYTKNKDYAHATELCVRIKDFLRAVSISVVYCKEQLLPLADLLEQEGVYDLAFACHYSVKNYAKCAELLRCSGCEQDAVIFSKSYLEGNNAVKVEEELSSMKL